ncbi:GGDEF domain-containing protein [Parazoarcus communis]|uniref:diguanylate cyclase n=1 Tax=Parazoarcus communis TaxID=41977 RepID=A0A2U8H332_9RHOO|nr:GGDEF domain-containing protein [Parazoarcus communis]AWI80352.1 GGDEF domain-containing protein [Parazoarcus communis]
MTQAGQPAAQPNTDDRASTARSHGKAGGAHAPTPSEIAREALLRLATQKIPPTPDNFRELYFQIAGTAAEDAFPARTLKAIAEALPRSTPQALRLARVFEKAVASGQWSVLRQSMLTISGMQASEPKPWTPLIRDLVRELERHHQNITPGRKRDSLEHVLAACADPDQLHLRLHALVRSWNEQTGSEQHAAMPPRDNAPAASADVLGPLLAKLLTGCIAPLANDEELASEANAIAAQVVAPKSPEQVAELAARLDRLIARAAWSGDEQREIREALLNLLRLIVDNVRELIVDDSWLHGQLTLIADTFEQPLDLRLLDEVERRLRKVIDKQSQLKHQLTDAQQKLKSMLAGFIDQLSAFSTSTEHYEVVLTESARRISEAHDIKELSDVVEEVLRETQTTQQSAHRSGEELSRLREQVESANQQIVQLQRELDETSELVRHDPLTGALNRKGLDEALEREIARMRRSGTSLSIALLDVDNFKQINDAHGHVVGDNALRHLARVVKETLRPQDSIARYGGEEFLILLPETEPDQAQIILVRLQRELTRRYFLAQHQHLLITFSAGIACLGDTEDPMNAIERADKAMYAAKRAGKNRVVNSA